MSDINKAVSDVISMIQNLDDEDFTLESSIEEVEIEEVEKLLDIPLPVDFRNFSSKTNGCSFLGNIVVPLVNKGDDSNSWDIVNLNRREHEEVENIMPKYFLPFSPNGRGDHYCFDLRQKNPDGTYPVIFWQWDYSFYYPDDIERTNDNFLEWIIELIEDEYS